MFLHTVATQWSLDTAVTTSLCPNSFMRCHQPHFTDEYTEAQSSGSRCWERIPDCWIPEPAPSHLINYPDFQRQGQPLAPAWPGGSKCSATAQYIRNQLGMRALSCKWDVWVIVIMKQMETVTQQQRQLFAIKLGSCVSRIRTGLGTSVWCPLGPHQITCHWPTLSCVPDSKHLIVPIRAYCIAGRMLKWVDKADILQPWFPHLWNGVVGWESAGASPLWECPLPDQSAPPFAPGFLWEHFQTMCPWAFHPLSNPQDCPSVGLSFHQSLSHPLRIEFPAPSSQSHPQQLSQGLAHSRPLRNVCRTSN